MDIKQGMVQSTKMLEMIPVKTENGRRKGIPPEDCFIAVMGALLSGQIAAMPEPDGNAAGMLEADVPHDMPEVYNSFAPGGNPGTQGLPQSGEANKTSGFRIFNAVDLNMMRKQDMPSGEISKTGEAAVGTELNKANGLNVSGEIWDASNPLKMAAEWEGKNGIPGLADSDRVEPARADHMANNEMPEQIPDALQEEDGLLMGKDNSEKYVFRTRNNMNMSKDGLINREAGMNEESLLSLEQLGNKMTEPVPQKIKMETQQLGLYEKEYETSMENSHSSVNAEMKKEIRVVDGNGHMKSLEEKFLPDDGINSGGDTASKAGDSSILSSKMESLSPQSQMGRVALDKLPARVGEFFHQVFIDKKKNTWELQLEPEALGKLKVTVNWDQGKISAEFFAETHQAAKALENYLDALKQNLGQKNIDVSTLNISIAGQGMGGGAQGSHPDFYRKGRGNGRQNDGLSVQTQEEREDARGEVSVNYLV